MTAFLQQLIDQHFSKGTALDLRGAQRLAEELGHPQKMFPSIHIAGSNGKGSVAMKMAEALHLAGYKVGLYTSPHIECIRERIAIQKEWISEREFEDIVESLAALCKKKQLHPTFFEILTFVAFLFFSQKKVDIAVIETGLGGRLDPTNIIHPILSVITSISKEHTALLGATEERIAYEKAGILKRQVPAVIGFKARQKVILEQALALESPLVFPEIVEGACYDEENSLTAKAGLQVIQDQFPMCKENIDLGVSVRPSCRFEEIGPFILDVAHNPDAFFRLLQMCRKRYPLDKFAAIIAISEDKDARSCLQILSQEVDFLYLVEAKTSRALSKKRMADFLSSFGLCSFIEKGSVASAIEEAVLLQPQKWDRVLICGTFYMMQEAKRALLNL